MQGKKIVLSIVLSFISFVIVLFCVISLKDSFISTVKGELHVVIIDEENNILQDKKIRFYEGDTMSDLLYSNFQNVKIDNGMIMSIDDLDTPNDWSYWICVYVNGEMSQVGILDVEFKDGTKIEFIMTKFDYEY